MADRVSDILDRAANQCSLASPDSWVSDTTASVLEMKDFLLETVDDVLDRVDLPSPITQIASITGDGSETYDLPPAFKRMTRNRTAVYDSGLSRRFGDPISDDGTWEYLTDLSSAGGRRYYRVEGYLGAYTISFRQPLESGVTVKVAYVSRNWLTDGTSTFDSEDAETVLPRRLLEAGIVARWRERKGLDYTPKLAEYEAILARLANDSRGRRAIRFGPRRVASPWDIPAPDTIPEA